MNRPTRRLAVGVMICFGLLAGMATYVQVLAADDYRLDPRNARFNLAQSGKERGEIVSADGVVLARSDPDPNTPGSYVRVYPEGAAFTHVVGYSSLLFGENGLERIYSADLRSRRDLTISDLIAVILGRDLRPDNLEITLDAELQRTALTALDGQAGSVVAINPQTGEILAMVSFPSYDPTQLLGGDAAAAWQALVDDPARPLADRTTRELYPPGSTFKVLVTGAALESGVAGPETSFPDPAEFPLPGSDATISNFDGDACNDGVSVTLEQAFVRSCNTTFANLAIQVGAVEIGAVANGFGFNNPIDSPWSVATSTFLTSQLSDDQAALGQSGIGERDVRATPFQMALVAAGVANDGVVMLPYLVERIFDADGNDQQLAEQSPLRTALSPATAEVLTQLMERVVTSGTGRQAAVPGQRVAGKTGTASGPGGQPHAWFIGFAPVEDPTIALAVLVEAGGNVGETATGGGVAAPIAAEVFAEWLNR
ncbi:MAG: penicillin-binding transpeptidase domain-containing protein [Acidimicrobiia bacterium]